MQSTLRALNERFGSHICGEGGEYETLTLDCPAFKKRIVLKETELVVLDDKDFATVAYLRIKSAILEEKDSEYPESIVQSPSQLDSFGQSLYDTPSITPSSQNVQGANYENIASFNKSLLVRRGRWLAIGNVNSLCDASVSLTEEAQRCFQKIKDLLDAEHLDLTDIVHVTALLRTMDDFASFNQVYSTMFGTSPPARACVAVQLPTPYRISLECIVHETTDKQSRSALHVQGISYWAPANIGPYSQAILIDRTIFISGQIGLIPATMSLPTPSDFRKEIALSLQHAKRIADVLQYQNWEPQGFVVWLVDSRNVPSAIGIMMEVIRKESQTGIASPPVLFVVPEALPKGAMGEVQMLAHCKTEETLDQDELERPSPGMTLSILYFNNTEEISTEQSRDLRNALSLKIFHCTTLEREVQTFIDDLSAGVAITLIPVKAIYNGSFPFDPCRFAVVSTH
ncbi:hypothetical protein FRC17_009262 [Serendipita sp. 399]|nr:hypothetical protein FRC17_009262 [Serendipita sp. 399]